MEQENLAGSLRRWALEEMKYHDSLYNTNASNKIQSLPSEDDFGLLCQKPLTDVWMFLLNNVRSIQTVKQVQGNLAFQQMMQSGRQRGNHRDEDEEKLQEKSNQLSREIAQCVQENGYLEKELEQASKSLMAKSLLYEKTTLQVRNFQRKRSILRTACNVDEEKVAEYTEYAERIDSYTNHILNKRKESQKDNCISGDWHKSKSDMETESCYDVRIVCEKIGQFLHRTIDGELDNQALETVKTDLWKTVKEVDADYSMVTICSSLAANAIQFAKVIRDEAVRVNIALDAQNLSFNLNERGQLLDISQPPSVQKNVQQLLQASNLNHMMRWFEAEKHKNESWKVEAQLDDLKTQMHKLIHRILGEHPYNVPLAKHYVDLLLQFAAERAVAPCLRKEMNHVLERISKAKADKEELQAKFSQIQDFKQVVEQKQSCIALLAGHNTSAPERLEKRRVQVKSYIDSRSIGSHDTRVISLSGNLSESLKAEVDKFSTLSLPCLLFVSLDSHTRVSVLDLSIGPSILTGAWDLFQIYPGLCIDLSLPEYKSPDEAVLQIRNLVVSSQESVFSLKTLEAGIQAACEKAHTSDDSNGIRDLCQRSKKHDETESQRLLPLVHKSMEVLESMRTALPEFRSNVKIWWEQPAQSLTPWVKTEGMTFDEWMSKWRIAVTAIHNKMATKPTSGSHQLN